MATVFNISNPKNSILQKNNVQKATFLLRIQHGDELSELSSEILTEAKKIPTVIPSVVG